MRNFTVQKKLRGIPRRIRSLRRWTSSFEGFYPSDIDLSENYWNYKIPVIRSMVEGRYSTQELKSICAQELIQAAHHIYIAKQKAIHNKSRVTCCICLPEMFSSELCIYNNEEYFKAHTAESIGRFGEIEKIIGKSLAQELGLFIPDGFAEHGVFRTFEGEDGNIYVSECWYFGEVC